jgi:hypothetical protein
LVCLTYYLTTLSIYLSAHVIIIGCRAGSAYRGADAVDGDFVPIQSRAWNHQSWLRLATKSTPLRGIIIGGLARRSHLNPLAESLPASLPALDLCLRVLKAGHYVPSLLNDTLRELGIPAGAPIGGPRSLDELISSVSTVALSPLAPSPAISFEHTPVQLDQLPSQDIDYQFPGSTVYRWVERLQAVKTLQRNALERTLREGNPMGGTPGADAEELREGGLIGKPQGAGEGEVGWGVGSWVHTSRDEAKALSTAIHEVAKDADALLSKIFFPDDVEELIATKLGVEMRDAVTWIPMSTAAQRCDDPTKPTAATASRFFAFLVAIGLAQYCY